MFEAEEQVENRSYLLHLSIIVLVILVIAVGIVYHYVRQQKPLSTEQASAALSGMFKARPSTIVHFHVGNVGHSRDEDANTPQYLLLKKAGYLKTKPGPRNTVEVKTTPLAESTFSQFPEFKKETNKDGTEGYIVPLAKKELASVTKVTMTAPSRAVVEYTWKWAPNALGEVFDANSKVMQEIPSWERMSLIQKHGADFYHGEPTRGSVTMVRVDKTWKIAGE
jgi:hypothetical protein